MLKVASDAAEHRRRVQVREPEMPGIGGWLARLQWSGWRGT
jgi:hypothetical protein